MLKSSRWKGLQTGCNDIYFRLKLHARNEEPTTLPLYLTNHATHRQISIPPPQKREKKRNKVDISRHTRIRLWYEFLKLRIAVEVSQLCGNTYSGIEQLFAFVDEHATARDRHRNNQP
ncbi:hypothetical protein NEUTE2DRAFT_94156, partial [Neurospora tetrasperma FGSC 2509]